MTVGLSPKPAPVRSIDTGLQLMSKLTRYLNGRNVFGDHDNEQECGTGSSNIPYPRSSSASTPPVTESGVGKLRRRRGSTGEISQVRERYKLGAIVGSGAFSSVRLAVDRQTGKEWAVKILRLPLPGSEPDDGESTLDEVVNEVRVLQTVGHHPSLTFLREYFLEGDRVYMILQLVRGGELLSALTERGSLPEEDARQILRTVLEGIAHLHRCGVAHRDLKLENLLLMDPSDITSVKIADFGLSKRMPRNKAMRTVCGTPMYVSPEALNMIDNRAHGNGYGPECDLWACGVIMFILLGGHPPFIECGNGLDEGDCIRLFRQIQRGEYSFADPVWELVSEEAKDLVGRFLEVDPVQRISAKDALKHPWFKDDKMAASAPSIRIKLECDAAWVNDGVLISS